MKRDLVKINFILLFLTISCVVSLSSCNDDHNITAKSNNKISFLGLLNPEYEAETRALSIDYLTDADYPYPIYIRMDVGAEQGPYYGIYEIKPGYEGRLASKNSDLNWIDSDSDHKFYGWTMPWKEDEDISSEEPEEISFSSDYYKNLNLEEKDYYNCAILEKFIGTQAGPVNYRDNGEYVELQFMHLVSKIYISSLNIVTNDGSTWQNVSGEITIFDFPKKGYFHRQPSEEDIASASPLRRLPYVAKSESSEDYGDMTYEISRGSAIYICPEIDFKDLQFKIKVNWPAQQGVEGEYYGDFSGLKITRRYNDEWDKEHQGETTLYANEVINLNLTLRQGNVTGMTATIGKWSDKNVGSSPNYPRKGVYNSSQFSDLLNASEKNIDELYDFYGGDPEDKDKVFHVYNDLEINSSTLDIPDGYTLDGMGHTVIKISEGNSITLKNVRDIYITDGKNTIFIDSDGNIFDIDIETGKMNKIGVLNQNGSTTIEIDSGRVS